MRVISIWQPWASLLIHGFKTIETRGWPAPVSMIGERFGIAATKTIRADQRAAVADPQFQRFYAETGLPPLDELPRGCVLGSAVLMSCDRMDQELVDGLTHAEYAFGEYAADRYAWRIHNHQAFGPYPARGAQGIWNWEPPHDVAAGSQDNHRSEEGAPALRRTLPPRIGEAGLPRSS